jgi:pimeloyl-ACP methyl ester carboxylesterase
MASVEAADGTRIDYHVTGDGRPLLLVHGITESSRTWEPLVEPLVGAGYRVLAMDLRGHGTSGRAATYDLGSMAADVGAVLADAGADSTDGAALLVGHSLGGAVVSAYAAGGTCRGVVNVDQPLALSGFKATLAVLEPMLRGTPEEFDGAISAVFEQMAGPLAGADRARVDGLRRASQEVVLGVWDLVLTASEADLDAVVDQLAGAITVPYLALHGIDPGPDYADWLTARVPGATVEVWADHGHYPHLIDRDRFVERIVAFDPG